MSDASWQPTASLESLRVAAALRDTIRDYMRAEHVLEVSTPALSQAATTDPNIHSFNVAGRYLHTSPEYPMKRLLVAHGVDIYQLCPVFRDDEQGRYHNAEFTLLEWYRIGFDHLALMHDVERLLAQCAGFSSKTWHKPQTLRYTDEVAHLCGKPFSSVSVSDIEAVFIREKKSYPKSIGNDLDAACDLLLDEFLISRFHPEQTTFIVDYPASQAALAQTRIDESGQAVASRFELYWGSVELANGFHELTDAKEQHKRFINDLAVREQRGLPAVPLDHHLIAALSHGLNDCAGVALGIDRLLMVLSGAKHIGEVQSFFGNRA